MLSSSSPLPQSPRRIWPDAGDRSPPPPWSAVLCRRRSVSPAVLRERHSHSWIRWGPIRRPPLRSNEEVYRSFVLRFWFQFTNTRSQQSAFCVFETLMGAGSSEVYEGCGWFRSLMFWFLLLRRLHHLCTLWSARRRSTPIKVVGFFMCAWTCHDTL